MGWPYSKNMNSGSIDPSAEMKKRIPAMINDFLRPRFVARKPERAEPMIQPMRAEAEVKPCQPSV